MKKFLIDDEYASEEEFYERLEEEVCKYIDDFYDDILDDCYPEIKIGSLTFSPSQVLQKCDPIAYSCGISDEQSFQLDDAKYRLERGEQVDFNGTSFEIEDEDED